MSTVRFDVVAREDARRRFGELTGPLVRVGMDPGRPAPTCPPRTDFRISQEVDIVKGVHATMRKADFG